jgi:hypothetical protein
MRLLLLLMMMMLMMMLMMMAMESMVMVVVVKSMVNMVFPEWCQDLHHAAGTAAVEVVA